MLSEQALENDSHSELPKVPIAEIYADSAFNCRGQITGIDVIELAADIGSKGLIEPIIIRKLWDSEQHIKDKGYKYSLVAGFRRLLAYKSHKNAVMIPAVTRDIKTVFEAKDINAVENLQREDLNLYQQAKAIEHYWMAGWTRDDICKRINKSVGWVQIRCMLLGMPEEIQKAAAQGYLNTQAIRTLNEYGSDHPSMLKAAGVLIERLEQGHKKANIFRSVRKKEKADVKKVRSKLDTIEMIGRVQAYSRLIDKGQTFSANDFFTPQGNSLLTRLLAWQAGEVCSGEIEMELEEFFAKVDVIYTKIDLDYS